jgi:hypothetical protein
MTDDIMLGLSDDEVRYLCQVIEEDQASIPPEERAFEAISILRKLAIAGNLSVGIKPLSTWAEEGEEGPEQLQIPGMEDA